MASEGMRGFYLGLGPNLVRSFGAALLLVSYDVFRQGTGSSIYVKTSMLHNTHKHLRNMNQSNALTWDLLSHAVCFTAMLQRPYAACSFICLEMHFHGSVL